MQHTEANIKIYFTRTHSIFNNIHGNRQLNERTSKEYLRAIEVVYNKDASKRKVIY